MWEIWGVKGDSHGTPTWVTLTLVCLFLLKSVCWISLCQLGLVGNYIWFPLWFQARVEQKRNLYRIWKAEVKQQPLLLPKGHCGQMWWQVQRYLVAFSSSSSSSWHPAAPGLPPPIWIPEAVASKGWWLPKDLFRHYPFESALWWLHILNFSDLLTPFLIFQICL